MSITVIEAGGDWRAVGRAYGEELRDPIRRAVALSADSASRLGGPIAALRERLTPYLTAADTPRAVRRAARNGQSRGARRAATR